jgi:PKHD-type hydroxylase
MNLQHYYWYFTKALSDKQCDDIIKHAKTKKESEAVIGVFTKKDLEDIKKNKDNYKKYKKRLSEVRKSNIVWLDDKWIYNLIHPYIHMANKNAGWNFQWDWSEPCQFTIYNKNQFYDWHHDDDPIPHRGEDINFKGKIRKLSVTVSLSDPKEYTGGELLFDFRNGLKPGEKKIKQCTEILPKGSICVFPSFVYHKVAPIKKGTRYSLVIWNYGWPYV